MQLPVGVLLPCWASVGFFLATLMLRTDSRHCACRSHLCDRLDIGFNAGENWVILGQWRRQDNAVARAGLREPDQGGVMLDHSVRDTASPARATVGVRFGFRIGISGHGARDR